MKVMKTKWIRSAGYIPKFYYKPCAEDAWKNLKDCPLIGVVNACGKTKGG